MLWTSAQHFFFINCGEVIHILNNMNISKNIFHHKKLFTIGVEEEYMLCDSISGDLVDKADEKAKELIEFFEDYKLETP